jgi:holo-[acyl-carrier protein] synthase
VILGIGNDIIEVERIKSAIEKYGSRFLDRLFTPEEQRYCLSHREPSKNFAGRFAAKEAFVKALGLGIGKEVSWLDIEILNDPHGKPLVRLSPRLNELTHPSQFLLSISHCRAYATAVVVRTK